MPLVNCSGCGKPTPDLRTCFHCQTKVNTEPIPLDSEVPDDLDEQTWSSVGLITDGTTAIDDIRTDHGEYDRQLGGYLFDSEKPLCICEIDRLVITDPSGESWKISDGFFSTGYLIASNERIIAVFQNRVRDQISSVEFTDVIDISAVTPRIALNQLIIQLADGSSYEYELERLGGEDLDNLVTILTKESQKHDSAESRVAQLENTIDEEISAAENATEAFQSLSALFERHDELTQIDTAFADADSLDDVVLRLAEQRKVGPHAETLQTTSNEESVPSATDSETTLRTRLKSAARNADPKDVGAYAVGTTLTLGGIAVSLPFSTAAGLGVLLSSGGIAGAYASSHPESTLAKVDPIQLGVGIRTRAIARDATSVTEHGTAIALEAFEHTDPENISPEYAKWVSEIDPEIIMQDAERAATAAERSSGESNIHRAKYFGGAFGVAHSYINNSTDSKQLEDLLDDELYQEIPNAIDRDDPLDET